MSTDLNKLVEHLRRVLAAPAGGDLTDGQLLARFLASRDEAAFAALVRRHGRLVLGVCRRVLGHEQDAEDCFQATFLVLARRAGAIRKRDALASWLYAVAYRVAREAQAVNLRRRARERQVEAMPHPEVQPAQPQDWRPLLDRELSALPERYRAPLVLCDLEGRSRREAAQQLGVPEGTLSSRLARARALLAKRLAKCGVSLSGTALAAGLVEGAGAAPALPSVSSTVTVAAGRALTTGVVSAKVLALTEGVMRAMLLTKLKVAAWVALLAVCVGAGAAYRATARELRQAADQPQVTRSLENELEALRLEVEALRKGLQATRERVKALETEVEALRPKGGAGAAMGMPGGAPGDRAMMMGRMRMMRGGGMPGMLGRPGPMPFPGRPGGYGGVPMQPEEKVRPKGAADPLADAEAALKKLRQNPNDRQAADALEQALKRLKEQRKPDGATGSGNPRKN